LLKILKEAGCYSVHLSIDSCSKKVREEVLNRKWKDVNVEEKLMMIHSYGIKTWVNFMVAAPLSTVDDDLDAIRLGKKAKISYLSFTTTTPVPNTELYNYCVENNLIDKNFQGHTGLLRTKSLLNCFSERDKQVRQNILCLGAIAAKMPSPLYHFFIFLIKRVPSNRFFYKIYTRYLNYVHKKIIFKLKY